MLKWPVVLIYTDPVTKKRTMENFFDAFAAPLNSDEALYYAKNKYNGYFVKLCSPLEIYDLRIQEEPIYRL